MINLSRQNLFGDFSLFSPVATGWQKSTRNAELFETARLLIPQRSRRSFSPMSKRTAKIKNKLPQQPKIIVKVTDMVHDHMAAAVHMQAH